MAEQAAAAAPSMGPGPSMLPVTKLPENVHPGFYLGEKDAGVLNRIVAYAIHTRCTIKSGDRELSAQDMCLHEVAFFRRMYEEDGGSLVLDPAWPPGLARCTPLEQDGLNRELERLRDRLIIPKNGGALHILPTFIGTEPDEQLKRLHEIMRLQLEAWAKALAIAKKRIPPAELVTINAKGQTVPKHPEIIQSMACDRMTTQEIEAIANIADPSRDGLGEIELPEAILPPVAATTPGGEPVGAPEETGPSLAEIEAQAEAEVDGTPIDPQEALVAKLEAKAGLDHQQALSVASLVDLARDPSSIPDDDLVQVLGSKAKLQATKRALKG